MTAMGFKTLGKFKRPQAPPTVTSTTPPIAPIAPSVSRLSRLGRMLAIAEITVAAARKRIDQIVNAGGEVTAAMRRTFEREAAKDAKQVVHWSPNGNRECQRRVRQNAHQQQRLSHQDRIVDAVVDLKGAKPWVMTTCSHIAVKPRHIFGNETI